MRNNGCAWDVVRTVGFRGTTRGVAEMSTWSLIGLDIPY
jgi:hypothetical protein